MKNKLIAILGAAIISAGTIGGVALASGISKGDQTAVLKESSVKASTLAGQNGDVVSQDLVEKDTANNSTLNVPSKNSYQDMTKIMEDNGFKDAAGYMQSGNYAAMADFMNNLSQKDYDKMIKIMNDNGYGYMAQMMQSIGKEGMTQMHNSMYGNGANSNGIMGSYQNGASSNGMMGSFR